MRQMNNRQNKTSVIRPNTKIAKNVLVKIGKRKNKIDRRTK